MLVKELHIEKSVNMMGMCNHDIVIEELEKEGFCGGEPVSGITEYIKNIDECGEIQLYQ